MSAVVLVVEPDIQASRAVEDRLRADGFFVITASSGLGGLDRAVSQPVPGVIVISAELPDLSGREMCRRLRSHTNTRDAVVILCSAKAEEAERVVAFEIGTDDYMVKPVSPRELSLRIRGFIRRAQRLPDASTLRFGLLTLDRAGHRVFAGGHSIDLTRRELSVLAYFMSNPWRIFTREQILEALKAEGLSGTQRNVDTQVSRLREKLGEAGRYLETVRNLGYRLFIEEDLGSSWSTRSAATP